MIAVKKKTLKTRLNSPFLVGFQSSSPSTLLQCNRNAIFRNSTNQIGRLFVNREGFYGCIAKDAAMGRKVIGLLNPGCFKPLYYYATHASHQHNLEDRA